MAFYGNGLTDGKNNYFSFNARTPEEGKLPNRSEIISGSEHVLIIDSSNRDLNYYPNSARYNVTFPESYKNVTSIELRGSVFPKTENNVNSSNYIIPFNVQDKITNVKIVEKGYGYVDGVYTSASGVTVSSPAISGGTQAEISVTVSSNYISNIIITNAGTGYLKGNYGDRDDNENGFYKNSQGYITLDIPKEESLSDRFKKANLELEIGTLLLAKLNLGQYDFTIANDSAPGLCREITRSLQEATQNAIDDGTLIVDVGGPTTGAGYFPYATSLGDQGSCMLSTLNENATPNNRVSIQRGKNGSNQSLFLELLWNTVSQEHVLKSSRKLLGYGSNIIKEKYFSPIDQTSGTTSAIVVDGSWVSTPITSRNNYNIFDSPEYFILELDDDLDRVESNNDQLEKCFATLIFDSNAPNVIWRSTPSSLQPSGTGNSDYTSLLSKPGITKPIKGYDFDIKKIIFAQPKSELKKLQIKFKKTNGDYYDFQGRDHLLIFNINCDDINVGNRF